MDIANIGRRVDLSEGEWIDGNPFLPGVRLKVRSLNYRPFRRALDLRMAKAGQALRDENAAMDFQDATGDLLAEHILQGWDGVTNAGKPLAYDAITAAGVLMAQDDFGIGQSFRRGVEWAGRMVTQRLLAVTEDMAGNSPAPSRGRSRNQKPRASKPAA
jgi:hypothetical protein